jgi:hypothetical protein
MSDRPEWFAQRRYGIGSGMPIAWQGWAVLAAFGVLIAPAVLLFGRDDIRRIAIVLPAIAVFLVIAAKTTRGGWHWRWGDDD